MEERTLEQGFALLDEITRRMEQKDVPLEEQFALYQQGMALVKECGEKIDTVEKKMLILNGGALREEE